MKTISNEINQRVFTVRKSLGMTRKEFGDALHESDSAIKNIEYNVTAPKPRILDNIADTFSINREWLETGVGEMKTYREEEKILTDMFTRLIQKPDTPLLRRIITGLVKLSPEERMDVEKFIARLLSDEQDKKEEEED